MRKRILSIILVLCLLCALLPAAALPASAAKSDTDIAYPVEGGSIYFDKASGAITDCDTSVTKANIPSTIDGVAVTSIGYSAFINCSSLTSVTIPESVTSIGGYAFGNCNSLTSVAIPNSVTSIGAYAFCACSSLTSVTIPNGVTSIGDSAFSYCSSLTAIDVAAGNTAYISVDGILFNKEKSTLIIYPARKTEAEYSIPNSVTSIDNYAFCDCSSLTSVTIPDSVTSIGDEAFESCSSLKSVTIPNSVTSIGDSAFSFCSSLTAIDVAAGNTAYSSVDGVLFHKEKSTLVAYPAGKTEAEYSIPNSVTSIDNYAFSYCSSLTSVTIPDSVTSIGKCAFEGCGLTSVTIPNGVTSIGDWTFAFCSSLTSVTIPDSVMSIGDWAFEDCSSLTSVTIGNSVTSIGEMTFYYCSSLTSVYFRGNAPIIGEKVFQIWDKETQEVVAIPNLTLYYIEGKGGWTTPTWNGYPTATWDGVNVPHTHSYTAAVTVPTCAERGYTTHTCECGDSYKNTYVDALGHDYKDGVCTRCGEKDPNAVPPVAYGDVSEKAWYYDAVQYATKNGLMNGVGGNKFDPNGEMTRAMLVTVLWRYAGQPKEGKNTFTDVPNGKWYTDAVAWAAENGIVNGVGNNRFNPNGDITREEMATILFRYANKNGIDTSKRGNLNLFPDANQVSDWAKDAVQWTVAEGIINGSDGKLLPRGNATRAQVATIFMRLIENIVKK